MVGSRNNANVGCLPAPPASLNGMMVDTIARTKKIEMIKEIILVAMRKGINNFLTFLITTFKLFGEE